MALSKATKKRIRFQVATAAAVTLRTSASELVQGAGEEAMYATAYLNEIAERLTSPFIGYDPSAVADETEPSK